MSPKKPSALRRAALVATAALSAVGCVSAPNADTAGDADTLRALDAAYVEGWLQPTPNLQEARVLALFAPDAAILPGAGLEQSAGLDQLRAFWFPDDAPPTIVTSFAHYPADVDVEGDLGVIRGRYDIRFSYDGADYARDGNYLLVARRSDASAWRITHLAWSDRVLD